MVDTHEVLKRDNMGMLTAGLRSIANIFSLNSLQLLYTRAGICYCVTGVTACISHYYRPDPTCHYNYSVILYIIAS